MNKFQPRHRRAFTVPEVLAVVAIIAIVLSMLLPSLTKSRESAHSAMCANNLHQLHVAYINRNVDVKGGSTNKISPYTWQTHLLPYANKDNRVFFCTSQSEGVLGGNDAYAVGGSSVASNVYLKVFNAYPNGYLYDMAMEEGPLCRRIHKTTTDATIEQLWSNAPTHIAKIKNYRDQLPDLTSYVLCFEDLRPGGGDLDFEDVIFMVDEEHDGVTFKFLYDGAGYVFDLVNRDGTVLAPKLDNGGDTKPGYTSPKVPGAPTSYGMTDQVVNKYTSGGKNVIFMLDYQRSVASCSTTTGLDPWADWLKPNKVEKFARHWDKANVMFFDGGVRLTSTSTINPAVAQNRTDYWIP